VPKTDDPRGDSALQPPVANVATVTATGTMVRFCVAEDQQLRIGQVLTAWGVLHDASAHCFVVDTSDAVHAVTALATAGMRFAWSSQQPPDSRPTTYFGFSFSGPSLE
jgi:hypothetical protein